MSQFPIPAERQILNEINPLLFFGVRAFRWQSSEDQLFGDLVNAGLDQRHFYCYI